jgi:DNA replication protein
MREFKGFPARMQFTPIPNVVYSSLLPQITDIVELKALLCVFKLVYPKKGHLRFASFTEIVNQINLPGHINDQTANIDVITKALDALVKRGALLHLNMGKNGVTNVLYFINNEINQQAVEKIQKGEIILPELKPEQTTPLLASEPSDIFTLYEQNIGMLTPLIADELREAEKQYPENWIQEAIKESANLNKRSWRYIVRILENWSTEGKDNGTYRGNLKKNADPDKYIRGKYGHMVQR